MAKSQLRAMGPTKIGEGKRYISQRDKQLGVSLHAYIYKYICIYGLSGVRITLSTSVCLLQKGIKPKRINKS